MIFPDIDPHTYRARACRICGGTDLHDVLSLGSMPLPNGFLRAEELNRPELSYPLGVAVCTKCWLMQLTHVLPPALMFRNYLYIPSTSQTMLRHFETLADDLVARYSLTPHDLVVDIGSNDGTLLQYFRAHETRVLGVDPASNLVPVARLQGVETLEALFSQSVSEDIRRTAGPAKVITATNVLAHIHTLHDACAGIASLLAPDGVFVSEFPYLVDLLEMNSFDTIYHEHLSYFALAPLLRLFQEHDLVLVDAEQVSVHGGSLRISVVPAAAGRRPTPRVGRLLEREARLGLSSLTPYEAFPYRVRARQEGLVHLLQNLRSAGQRIVGYGASAKGNVLLNACHIGPDLVEYIVDTIPYKQGRFTPGTHIPIFPAKKLEKDAPDALLLLAWNFSEEIQEKTAAYRARGGRFIVHVPDVRMVGELSGLLPTKETEDNRPQPSDRYAATRARRR